MLQNILLTIIFFIMSDLVFADDYSVAEIINREAKKFAIIVPSTGLSAGSNLESYRELHSYKEKSIPTGKMKIIQVFAGYALAEIFEDGSEFSRTIFSNHSYVMAGDQVEPEKISIARDLILTEDVKLTYTSLFEDPNPLPSTFELSEKGKESLKESLKSYIAAKISKIAILGFTSRTGSADVNRVESMQRAMTVRQFLIDEVNIDKDRIVHFGMGEEELAIDSNHPSAKQKNRRIEIRAIAD